MITQTGLLWLIFVFVMRTEAKVEFTHSTMYDYYDLDGVTETPLPRCDNGCLIFASIYRWRDDFVDNITIYDSLSGQNTSFGDLAKRVDPETLQKIPLSINNSNVGGVSILNRNKESSTSEYLLLWVVDSSKANEIDYEVYDMNDISANHVLHTRRNLVVTIIGTVKYTQSLYSVENNHVTARLAGFDNAFDDNPDYCEYAFKSPMNGAYWVFNFDLSTPMVSFLFNGTSDVTTSSYYYFGDMPLYPGAFYTSYGYNGCKKLGANEVYRSQGYDYDFVNYYKTQILYEDQRSTQYEDQVTFDIDCNLTDWKIVFTDLTNGVNRQIEGTGDHVGFQVSINYDGITADQSFIIRFNTIQNSRAESPSTKQTTTITAYNSPDDYCQCAMDKFGLPLGWESTDIWLDVVIVLDTSEEMTTETLQDAGSFIESLLGDDDYDVLTTDKTATFYTRVGVIAMADVPQVLYNLNMAKKDSVRDKVTIRKGLSEIDLSEAFYAAQVMLADGLTSDPSRATTRQVIHFITNSQPKDDVSAIVEFKKSGGVIIVNNVLNEGESPKSELKSLASDGYFFSDVSDYMDNVQALCKANCFCAGDHVQYSGPGSDPAVAAAGGCFRVSVAGVSYSKAKQTCADTQGGVVATVHDESKNEFLNQLITEAVPKQYFFWIGYSKGDDGNWQWEDGSSVGYTNWAIDEPSSASVAKCAYVDQSEQNLPWGAGNCQMGLPYACQYEPCSVGNKNC